MPALPTVLARSAGGVVGVPNVQVNNGAVAEGLGRAAAGLERLDAKFQEADEREGRIWATRRNAELRAALIKAGTERELSGEPLDNFGTWYETAAKEAYATALDDAPNNFGRMYLDDYSVSAVSNFGEAGLRKEADYRVTQSLTQLDGTLESLKSLAFLDPGNAETYAAQWRDALDGTPLPYDKAAALKDSEQAIFGSAIGSMVESDPYGALGKVGGWVKEGYLNAEQGLTFQNRAQAGIKSREAEAKQRANEAKAARAEAARLELEGVDDFLAFVAAGNVPPPDLAAKYSPDRILALTGSEKAAKQAADAFTRGEGMRDLLNAGSPAERAKVLEEAAAAAADPENFKFNQDTFRIYQSVNADLNDKLVKDPGGVAEMSTRVQDAIKSGNGAQIVAASYAEQERQGVPSYARKPLSNAYAEQLAAQIGALPPEEQVKALQEMEASYGSSWKDVLQQIGTKLPAGLAIVSTLPRNPDGTANRAATTAAAVAAMKIDDLAVGLDKGAKGDAEEAVLNNPRMQALNRMLRTQDGGPQTFAQYSDLVTKMTLKYVGDGMDFDTAADKAALGVTEDTDFREVNNSMVGIPTAANPDMVEAGMGAAIKGLDIGKLDLPPSMSGMADADARAALASNIERNAEWVPDGKGKGVYLRVIGEPVTINGEPVFFTWEELKGAAPKRGVYNVPSVNDAAAEVAR